VGLALHRRREEGGAPLNEPARRLPGLTPVSFAERSLAAGAPQWVALAAIACSALAADQLTKLLVTNRLALDEGVHVVGPFWIHHVQNSGIAFGLFPRSTATIALLTSVAVLWMLWFFARSGSRHPVLPTALGLLVGGSLSNLADRLRLGHVTDFLDLSWWPSFNLADTFICVGVAILLLTLLAADRAPRGSRS